MIRLCEKTRSADGRWGIVGDGHWLGSLHDELCAALAPVFAQARSRLAAFAYIGALLAAGGDRRSCCAPAAEVPVLAELRSLAVPA
jgi:hypothetical protein